MLLNDIARVGGTTAITDELSHEEMRDWFISGADVVSSFVAINSNNEIAGFQALSTYGDPPAGTVDIATLARRSGHKSGIGGGAG